MAREGVPLPVIQRQLGHAHPGRDQHLPPRHRHHGDHRHHPQPTPTHDPRQRRPHTLTQPPEGGARARPFAGRSEAAAVGVAANSEMIRG
jgi:hypothetical protein